MKINNVIQELLIDNSWRKKSPRGLKTIYKKNVQFLIDPFYPILDNQIRKFNWKYFTGELCWFLIGDENINFISNFSKFWNNIVDQNGNVNSNYGTRLLTPYKNSQIKKVYDTLINDKDSRQGIAFISGKEFQIQTKDFPCTIYLNFSINDNHLDLTVRMRSNDIVFGLSYDAPWFSIIHQNLYLLLKEYYYDLKLGNYTHSADDFHWYVDRHSLEINSFKDSIIDSNYRFELTKPLFKFINDSLILTEEGKDFIKNCKYDKNNKDEYYLNLLSKFMNIQKENI